MSERGEEYVAPPCPRCGASRALRIIYGFPIGPIEAVERGEATLGGCVVGFDSPRWQCRVCQTRFGLLHARDSASNAVIYPDDEDWWAVPLRD